MEDLNRELDLQTGEADVVRGLRALNTAQDHFETLVAVQAASGLGGYQVRGGDGLDGGSDRPASLTTDPGLCPICHVLCQSRHALETPCVPRGGATGPGSRWVPVQPL